MKKYKEAAIALFLFKPYIGYGRKAEIFMGIFAWVQLISIILNTYTLIVKL